MLAVGFYLKAQLINIDNGVTNTNSKISAEGEGVEEREGARGRGRLGEGWR